MSELPCHRVTIELPPPLFQKQKNLKLAAAIYSTSGEQRIRLNNYFGIYIFDRVAPSPFPETKKKYPKLTAIYSISGEERI